MQKAAEQNHALGLHGLGFMYLEGEGVKKDYLKAADCFRQAADQGLAGSLTTLASMYEQGLGVAQDLDEAQRLYKRAGF
jgi:TPR repeat protein